MELIIKNFIKNNNININNKVVIAISGGADSIALLHVLYNLGYDVIMAHVNHHKRIESEMEEKEMIKLASSLNVPIEVFEYHYNNNDNFHNDSHNKRYEFFKNVCKKYNTNIIATAHHLDDQIETILMKMLEGSNLYGYGGISPSVNIDGINIIRPFLCVNKDMIYDYNHKNNYIYFEDSSNQEDIFLRNRIRHHIIPLLKKETTDFYKKVSEYSNQIKEAFNFIRSISIKYLLDNNNQIKLDSFNLLDMAVKKDIISLLLENNNINKNNEIINNILNILSTNNGNKEIKLSNNYLFIKSYDVAFLKQSINNSFYSYELNENDVVIFDNKYKIYFSKNIPHANAKYLKLCYNNLKFPFICRNKKDGDKILMIDGTKSVSRLFINTKIKKEDRLNTLIITDSDNNIFWVYDIAKAKCVFEQRNNSDIYLVCEEL